MVRLLKTIGVIVGVVVGTSYSFSPARQFATTRGCGISVCNHVRSSLMANTQIETSMSSVLQKSPTKTGGAAVAAPETEVSRSNKSDTQKGKQRKGHGNAAWQVRIYNDALNTREHVARSLVQITGLSEATAYKTMMQAHQNGIAVVGRWDFEIAEMYHDALRKRGIVCDLVPVDE